MTASTATVRDACASASQHPYLPPPSQRDPDSTISTSARRHQKRDSKVSIATSSWTSSHREYIDSLEVPTTDMVAKIAEIQEKKEEIGMRQRLEERADDGTLSEGERSKAAELIQRNYRGHRERRMLEGMSLDPTTRWVEAVKEARYRHLTEPRPRTPTDPRPRTPTAPGSGAQDDESTQAGALLSPARANWRKVGMITRRAGGDEDAEPDSGDDEDLPEQEREAKRKIRLEAKAERQKAAKMMDLQYFLEMVDLKHRYGSNLRTYHEEWKKSDTKDNFFYWLDYGEGRLIEAAGCPRDRLEKEQVRYLSKEERLDYLVMIDNEGRLCWAKNGVRIDTTEAYKDSIHGIVPADDTTPAYTAAEAEAATGLQDHHHAYSHGHSPRTSTSSSSSVSSDCSLETDARADKYATPTYDKSKGVKKIRHVSAATVFNKLLRGSVKKNTWIFVADTSFRLYVGIKQSGAFQHSSFLHGSRISAAGLIKVKAGRLDKLSPLSGHYRPPVSNFRAFVHSLKDAGVDMSHVSISRSYAVLVGLETYVKTRRQIKKGIGHMIHGKEKLLSPEELKTRQELERDKSESAEKERNYLEKSRQAEAEDRLIDGGNSKLLEKMHLTRSGSKDSRGALELRRSLDNETNIDAEPKSIGTGPENAIAPEGKR